MAARDFGIPFDWLSLFKVGDRIAPFQDNPSTIYVYLAVVLPFDTGEAVIAGRFAGCNA